MKTALALAGAALAGALAAAPSAPSVYTDGLYGFSVQAPDFPGAPEGGSAIRAMFFAPAEDGFSDNVNVMAQGTGMTLPEFIEVSADQFKAHGLKVNSESKKKVSGRDAVVWDYEGKQQGRDLRWLALAVADKKQVFLVTCTATKKSFEKRRKEFEACLDSFKLAE
jgi:hypothetical protein